MKQLKFEHVYVEKIMSGERHTTLRIDDKDIRVGERIQLIDKVSSNKPQEWLLRGELHVVAVQEYMLGNVPLALLADAEIGAADKDSLITFLRRFYGESIHEETAIKLITFDYEPYPKPLLYLEKQGSLDGAEAPKHVVLYADGGSRGNPGPSASGFVIETVDGLVVESWNKYLGITTNNQAEYHGLIAALEWCRAHQVQEVEVRLDSLLVVNQMRGQFKVKNRDLWTLYESAKTLAGQFQKISFTHVPRELNKRADTEVNKALDSMSGKDVVQ
ncbi:MAG TPA: reverse transcriptase-like protein [Candidatus Saccharibacteria bacterium]|jgi:ribonuclease HI|nr:reverse transcriptase-like protein [Candidatus Saccharibacteria bacterium]